MITRKQAGAIQVKCVNPDRAHRDPARRIGDTPSHSVCSQSCTQFETCTRYVLLPTPAAPPPAPVAAEKPPRHRQHWGTPIWQSLWTDPAPTAQTLDAALAKIPKDCPC